MTVGDLTKIIIAMPEARAISNDEAYWREAVGRVIDPVLDEIAISYDWDFTLNDYTDSSVGGQAEYTLTGESNDLRDIVAIRYGTSLTVLIRMRAVDAYDYLENGSNFGSVAAWYQSGVNSQGYPKITLMDTPATASTFKVLYRKKGVPLSSFPSDFSWMVVKGVLAFVDSSRRVDFENALRRTIKRYKAGGKDYNQIPADPHIVAGNQTISDLYGVG